MKAAGRAHSMQAAHPRPDAGDQRSIDVTLGADANRAVPAVLAIATGPDREVNQPSRRWRV